MEKEAIASRPPPHKQSSLLFPIVQWRLGALTTFVFLGMLVIWSIDGSRVKSFIDEWRPKQDHAPVDNLTPADFVTIQQNQTLTYSKLPLNATQVSVNSTRAEVNPTQDLWRPKQGHAPVDNLTPADFVTIQQNQTLTYSKLPSNATQVSVNSTRAEVNPTQDLLIPGSLYPRNWSAREVSWVSAQLEPDFSSNLLARWLAPGGEPCRESKTEQIVIPGLDSRDSIELSAGEVHEFLFTALDSSGNHRCLGGDYYETDLSGESWKSRPPVKDFGNGSYSVSLQVHPNFVGDYNLTIILLFRHFEGLKFSTTRFVIDRKLRSIPVRFYRSRVTLPYLLHCESADFSKDVWVGRWTRHGKNEDCRISKDGRYRCLAPDFTCRAPWCNGSLGALESNGWVYSAHCSFRLFSSDSAWNCLKNRWIFFWGDSNHVDTIRNILNFILGHPEIRAVPRRFDLNFTNPKDPSQSVRITSIFNGHSNETRNYEGLDSLRDEGFRDLLKKYFSEDTVPDTMIMNSGLHDGIHWRSIRGFINGAKYAASFWKDVMESVRRRGLSPPRIFYRTTVATGGHARSLGFNPSKMEAFNGIALDQFRKAGLVSGVIDNFDLTFPWHFDNRCNDGVHYGRAAEKKVWRDGKIGHQYFVDLMLAHILLNAICSR